MISFEEAFKKAMNEAERLPLRTTTLDVAQAVNHVSEENIMATEDYPPFSKSAVDGFACLKNDLNQELTITGTITAGEAHDHQITQGSCYRIMTGAAVPGNAEIIVMKEDVEEWHNTIKIKKPSSKTNLIIKGEDAHAGEVLLAKGTWLQPRHTGIITSAGYKNISVNAPPATGIINTGSELVEPGERTRQHQIINSNGTQLKAQLYSMGIETNYYGIARDNKNQTLELFRTAIAENDLVLITGGVSEGDYDLVPEILENLEFQIIFDKISTQPGKPTTLAVKDSKAVFGFPGNPVSAFVIFKQFAEPFIIKSMKGKWTDPSFEIPLKETFHRKNSKRDKWIPANIEGNAAVVAEYHGSAHIHSISYATHIMLIKQGINTINKGDPVRVRPL